MHLRTTLLVALLLFASMELVYLLLVYFATEYGPSDAWLTMNGAIMFVVIVALLCADNERTGVYRRIYDLDFLVWSLAPVAVPHYLIRSRGALGGLYLLLLVALFNMEWIVYALWSATAV